MSFQVGSVCYDTALAATNAIGSAQSGMVVQLGSDVYTVSYLPMKSQAYLAYYVLTSFRTGNVIIRAVSINHVPCSLIGTSESLLLGWSIACVWLVAAAIKTLNRGIHE